MFKNAKHWSNNFAGLFIVAVVFFAVTIAVNRHSPSAAVGTLLWLFALIGLAALGGWTFLALKAGQATGERVLFGRR